MLGITGARNASLKRQPAPPEVSWCATRVGEEERGRHRGIGARTADCSGAGDPSRRREYPRGTISGRRAGRTQACAERRSAWSGSDSSGRTWPLLPGAEHERTGLEPEHYAEEGAGGRRHDGFQGGSVVALRCGQHPPRVVSALARADRRRGHRNHETGAILINTSRGPIVDEKALIEAVQSRRMVPAVDVFDREPLPANHPLRNATNAVLTPHLGYGVQETWRGSMGKASRTRSPSSTESRCVSPIWRRWRRRVPSDQPHRVPRSPTARRTGSCRT